MRILVVNEFLAPETGGATQYVTEMTKECVRQGHQVALFHCETAVFPEIQGLRVLKGFPGLFGFNYSRDKKLLETFIESVARFSPEVVYVHQVLNPAVMVYLASRWPTVRYEHGIRLSCPNGRRMPKNMDFICDVRFGWKCLGYAYTRHCLPRNPFLSARRIMETKEHIKAHQRFRKILVASQYIRRLLVNQGLPDERVEVLPYFTEIPETAERKVDWNTPEVLFVGRMTEEKGGRCFIEALSHIRQKLIVSFIGDGPSAEEWKRFGQKLNMPHVLNFLGWQGHGLLSECYRRAALLVVPSLWPEAFGINGIEAMAHGVPSVAFDVGGIADWLADGKTGFLVKRGNVTELADRIARMAFDREKNASFGAAARIVAEEKYTLAAHWKALERVLTEAAR